MAVKVDHRMVMVNELAEATLHLDHARKLALAKGVLTDRQARRLSRATRVLEEEISVVLAEVRMAVRGEGHVAK